MRGAFVCPSVCPFVRLSMHSARLCPMHRSTCNASTLVVYLFASLSLLLLLPLPLARSLFQANLPKQDCKPLPHPLSPAQTKRVCSHMSNTENDEETNKQRSNIHCARSLSLLVKLTLLPLINSFIAIATCRFKSNKTTQLTRLL